MLDPTNDPCEPDDRHRCHDHDVVRLRAHVWEALKRAETTKDAGATRIGAILAGPGTNPPVSGGGSPLTEEARALGIRYATSMTQVRCR